MKSDFVKNLIPVEGENEDSSDDFRSRLIEVPEGDKISSVRSKISAAAKGLIKGLQDFGGLNPLGSFGPIPAELGLRATEQVLPTKDEPTEKFIERTAKLAPFAVGGPGSIARKTAGALAGGAAGQIAEGIGAGETGQSIAELAGMAIPDIAKGVSSFIKAPTEKLSSGLTKPRAVDAKAPRLASITKERQKKVIEGLNKEASDLAKKSLEKHHPIVKEIEKGVDFEKQFQEGFGEVQKLAEKHNPEVDINPISKFFKGVREKYSNIPNLHPEAKQIMSELRSFYNRPQSSLKNLLKIYRNNNIKQRQIFETSRLTGKQKEYSDFLNDFNKSIIESFKKTLPEDSAWLRMFQDNNRLYKSFKDSEKTAQQLKFLLQGEPTAAKIEKLAEDVKSQKRLITSMGEEGAQEVIQIARDLKKARKAISKIPVKEKRVWDNVLPVGIFVPYAQAIGAIGAAKKARYAYGWLLSSPARREAFQLALKAIANNDINLYKKAASIIQKESEID